MTVPTTVAQLSIDPLDSADARLRECRADGQGAAEVACPECGLPTLELDLQPLQAGGVGCFSCFFAGWKLLPLDDEVAA